MANILIIDDDPFVCEFLDDQVSDLGHLPDTAYTLRDGIALATSGNYDVVFLDVRLPDGNGLEALPDIRACESDPEVIIITGAGDPDGAELAIRNGAWDYIHKENSLHDIILPLSRALQYRKEKRGARAPVSLNLGGMVGGSPLMRACYDLLAQASTNDSNILVTGETGTGKELFARAIHENSARSGENFVVVDCASIPESLVESLLFGHVKGAFTGADRHREGLIKQADGGTLFLDEVGELPVSLQKAFLRVLEQRRFRPIGSALEVKSDFRLVAATNRDLNRLAQEGGFRKDLLFRIRTLTVELPPLRERLEDLKELVLQHTARLCERYALEQKGFSSEFVDALTCHNWPGNIRELVNTLEYAVSAAGQAPTLFYRHLPENIRVKFVRHALESTEEKDMQEEDPLESDLPPLREYMQCEASRIEATYMRRLMTVSKGDVREACRISGLSRSSLYERLKKHDISREP